MTVETIAAALEEVSKQLKGDVHEVSIRSSPIYDEGLPRRGWKVIAHDRDGKVVEVYANNG